MTSLDSILKKFTTVSIEKAALESTLAQRCFNLFPPEKIEVVEGKPTTFSKGHMSAGDYTLSKKRLFLTEHPGHFFKRCPGAKKGLACCNYYVLNLGQQCDMDCSYCYLQSFLNTPYTVIYTNIDKALGELAEMYASHSTSRVRVGTGEVVDSLSLDPLTNYSHALIDFFRDKPTWNLEFKTKSSYVENLLSVPASANVIVSWSINPQFIVEAEEHGTASLADRLTAAKKCLEHGYQIAFHIDPVIWHTNWKKNYLELAETIHAQFRPQDLPYISLGALRFQTEQRDIMRERFGMDSWVTRAEMFKSTSGKMRYDQSLREEMFQTIIQKFKELDPKWKIFLCMETPETWINSTGQLPYKQENIRSLFKPLQIESTPNTL
jgi:spore photoproduct lyase